MSKTRNQIRRERTKNTLLAIVCVVMWVFVSVLMIRALDHPAEQPISGTEWVARIENMEVRNG